VFVGCLLSRRSCSAMGGAVRRPSWCDPGSLHVSLRRAMWSSTMTPATGAIATAGSWFEARCPSPMRMAA